MAAQAPKAVMVIQTDCTDPAREQEFNEWYNNIHVPDVLLTPGVIRGTRFALATTPREGQSKFLAIYELDTTDFEGVQKSLGEVMAKVREQGRWSDLVKVGGFGLSFYSLISDRVKVGATV